MKELHLAVYPDFVGRHTKDMPAFITRLIEQQMKMELPVLTIFIKPLFSKPPMEFYKLLKETADQLAHHPLIHDNQIKISVLGKWYDMADAVVESLKHLITGTKDYDGMFLNLCVNYDGQDDIVESTRMIVRRVLTGKLKVDEITADTVKENVYSSFFLPPSEIILLDGKRHTDGLLLWDTAQTTLRYVDTPWDEWDVNELTQSTQ